MAIRAKKKSNRFGPMNRAETSEALQVDLNTIDKWRRRGCPHKKKGRTVEFRLPAVIAWLLERERETTTATTGAIDLEDARKRKTAAEAGLAELALRREMGEVVSIDDIATTVGKEYAACRARLLAIPAKLAPLLMNATKARECRALLERAICEALDELSSGDIDLAG